MTKYRYPAVVTQEEDGLYSVCFPDFESCLSCGCSPQDAMEMAQDALSLFLYDLEQENGPIPAPTPPESLKGELVILIDADTDKYQETYCRCKKCHQATK